ncbi:unnamed protein product [Discula destructiva]
MRTSILSPLLPLLSLLSLAAAATTTTITLAIPPSALLPNPRALPPSTHATLTTLGTGASAYITPGNTLVFPNVSAGSYLVDVHSLTHAFAPLRIDVVPVVPGAQEKEKEAAALKVQAWETYRGNDWDNKGEAVVLDAGALRVRVLGQKAFFMERSSFNVLSILKNPMILLGLVSMGIFIGMPYLMDNMDPEMKKEFEESQKSGPMASLMGGGGGSAPNPMANFDMASYLSGAPSKDVATSNNDTAAEPAPAGGKKKGGRK